MQQPYVIQTPYSESDFEPYAVAGQSSLLGQAFLKTVGGDVKTCAGNTVFLMPATAYNREVIAAPAGGYANKNDASVKYTKQTTCDAEGRFAFTGLAPLSWIIVVDVTWGVPQQYGVDQQGGMLAKTITLSNGENSAIVADSDRQ